MQEYRVITDRMTITTVIASSEEQARRRAEDTLGRPGREDAYEAWAHDGRQVEPVER